MSGSRYRVFAIAPMEFTLLQGCSVHRESLSQCLRHNRLCSRRRSRKSLAAPTNASVETSAFGCCKVGYEASFDLLRHQPDMRGLVKRLCDQLAAFSSLKLSQKYGITAPGDRDEPLAGPSPFAEMSQCQGLAAWKIFLPFRTSGYDSLTQPKSSLTLE